MNRMKISKDNKVIELRCTHEQGFPPLHVLMEEEWGDVEEQRKKKLIATQEYEQVRTWQRVCGLKEMGDKCLSCPLCQQEDGVDYLTRETKWVAYKK